MRDSHFSQVSANAFSIFLRRESAEKAQSANTQTLAGFPPWGEAKITLLRN
jgi:hypothetical protein